MRRLKGFIFTVRWFWKNRDWNYSRQKVKAFDRDYHQYIKGGD